MLMGVAKWDWIVTRPIRGEVSAKLGTSLNINDSYFKAPRFICDSVYTLIQNCVVKNVNNNNNNNDNAPF